MQTHHWRGPVAGWYPDSHARSGRNGGIEPVFYCKERALPSNISTRLRCEIARKLGVVTIRATDRRRRYVTLTVTFVTFPCTSSFLASVRGGVCRAGAPGMRPAGYAVWADLAAASRRARRLRPPAQPPREMARSASGASALDAANAPLENSASAATETCCRRDRGPVPATHSNFSSHPRASTGHSWLAHGTRRARRSGFSSDSDTAPAALRCTRRWR